MELFLGLLKGAGIGITGGIFVGISFLLIDWAEAKYLKYKRKKERENNDIFNL